MEAGAAAVLDLARALLAETDPDAAAAVLLERLRSLTGAQRGFVVVKEGERYVQRLDFAYDRASIPAAERAFSRTLVHHAIESRSIVAVDDADADVRFASAESVMGMVGVSIRVAAMVDAEGAVGAIYLDRRGAAFAPEVAVLLEEMRAIAALVIRRALERETLRNRNRHLERDLFEQHDFRGIVTRDPSMMAVLRMVAQVADSDATVLILGETGTGKELVARALHANSPRAARPFITVHCAALPQTLIEAELFGHAKGAFSGAERERPGRLAAAHRGTLFLDEIAEISLEVQAKLLRFLQFGELQRVGVDRVDTVDARIVAATHTDLGALVAAGKFRADLFYRLKVIELVLPPLRERGGDMALLADKFLAASWRRPGERPRLTPRAERALAGYHFPGNVRELAHLMQRAALLASTPEIDLDVLFPGAAPVAPVGSTPSTRFDRYDHEELQAFRAAALENVDREFVSGLLVRTDGNVSEAARRSGVNRTYLQKILGRLKREPDV